MSDAPVDLALLRAAGWENAEHISVLREAKRELGVLLDQHQAEPLVSRIDEHSCSSS